MSIVCSREGVSFLLSLAGPWVLDSVPARDAAQVSLANALLSAQTRTVIAIVSGKHSHLSLLPGLPSFLP